MLNRLTKLMLRKRTRRLEHMNHLKAMGCTDEEAKSLCKLAKHMSRGTGQDLDFAMGRQIELLGEGYSAIQATRLLTAFLGLARLIR